MKLFENNPALKKISAISIAAAVLFAGSAFGGYIAARGSNRQATATELTDFKSQQPIAPTRAENPNPIVQIVKQSSPAVVNIDTDTKIERKVSNHPFASDPFFREFFGDDFFGSDNGKSRTYHQRAKGSGFIVSKDGYILTNNHVVEGADIVKVTLLDGRRFTAKKVGQDPTFDIAVIKIDGDNLPVLRLGDSDKTEIGEQVIAIGNSLGFENTVTAGVISAKNRTLQDANMNLQGFMQTDAAINPGNSGGPLIDFNGNAIAINTAIVPYGQGLGFAVPINMAKQVMDDLIKHGKVRRGYLGAVVQPLTPSLVEAYKIPVKEGSIIADIQSDGPAEKFGLKRGDVIVDIGGTAIKDSNDVVLAVRGRFAGDKVPFTIYRDGKKMTVNVTLAEIKNTEANSKDKKSGKRNSETNDPEVSTRLGITVSIITRDIRSKYQIKEDEGLVVIGVEQNSDGAEIGLRRGDVILEINRQKMTSISDWNKAVSDRSKAYGILVSRRGQTLFISVDKE